MSRGRSGQSKPLKSELLPKQIINACCTNDINCINDWVKSGASIDACSGLADLLEGAAVEARFHGGEEFYEAQVKTSNSDGTYSIEYKEHGLIWGEYENCPRDHIRIAGSTVGGETALILAAENNSIDVLEVLLEAKANVNLFRTNGDTALIAASAHDFEVCVKKLIVAGAQSDICNGMGDNAYSKASSSGASVSLGLLLEIPGAVRFAENINMAGLCSVQAAAKENRVECLDKLLKVGCSPDKCNKEGESAIMVTARFDTHLACSKRLLASGCNLEFGNTVNGDDVLKLAARFGNTKLVLLLADGDMAPPSRVVPNHRNANGDTALMLAVAQGSPEAVRSLTHMPGAPLDARNAQGDSALTWAVWYGHGLLVKELLSAGASPNLSTAKGETALMFAAYRNQVDITKCLLDCKADPKLQNDNGDTALALASGCGNAPICVELLLEAGVNPDVRDGQGHTPLMLAVGQGNFECARALLKTGSINTAITTANGDTVADFIDARADADSWTELLAGFTTVHIPEKAEARSQKATPTAVVEVAEDELKAADELVAQQFEDAMGEGDDGPMLVVEGGSATLLEHYDDATGQWVMMDASTGQAMPSSDATPANDTPTADFPQETTSTPAPTMTDVEPTNADIKPPPQKGDTSLDADFALALALEEQQRNKQRPPPALPPPTRNVSAKQRKPKPVRGQLVAVNLARLPDGKNFGISITQSPAHGVRILAMSNHHDTLEAGDRIIEVNGCNVLGLGTREVSECVRKRRQDKILSLVVEKPRKWGLGRFFNRKDQQEDEATQRFMFGGTYPRTLHLTIIGAIGLPPLYPLSTYPNSYVEVTNRTTACSFRTKVVRNNAFPVWEEMVEVVVRSPDDQIVVQLLSEQLERPTEDVGTQARDKAHGGASDGCRKLSQKLRLPHYDKRFCCDREVSLALVPFSHSPMLAALPTQSTRPLMLRAKASWEDSVADSKLKAKQHKEAEKREKRRNRNRAGSDADTSTPSSGYHETMHLSLLGLRGLPPFLLSPALLQNTYIQLRNMATDQVLKTRPLLEALEISEQGSDLISLSDFFVVNMRNGKDKIELVLLSEGGHVEGAGGEGGPSVLGFATLPHHDERIMGGKEAGLRVRLVESIASKLPPRAARGCVLELVATWGDASLPKCLIVNVIGFSLFEDALGSSPNLHVQVSNQSTGQVNRTRTQRDSAFPIFEEVFHVRVKSDQDRVVLSVLNRGDGHLSEDVLVGSVDLSLNDKVLNNREAALELTAIHFANGKVERKIVGILQIAAMWETVTMSS